MKKIIALIMVVVTMLMLCACGAKTTDVTSEVVEAIVTDAYTGRWGSGIIVEYDDVKAQIDDITLYNKYNNNIGTIIKMVLITRIYENEDVKKTLVFNENVYNGGSLK